MTTWKPFSVDEELVFSVYGNVITGLFQSEQYPLIRIKVLSDDQGNSQRGEIITIHQRFLNDRPNC